MWEVCMKSNRVRPIAWLVASLVAVALVVTACAPNANELLISPRLGDQLAALEAGNDVVAAAPTEAPKLAELAPDQIAAGLPDDVAAALAAANPDNGAQVALARGCVGCHALDPAVTMTGPTWYHVGDTAVSRVAGESPALYLYHSIINPGGFVVANYPSGVMPANYSEQLSVQELADLIAYLLQQNEASGS
jgi:cytochrome c551/c552